MEHTNNNTTRAIYKQLSESERIKIANLYNDGNVNFNLDSSHKVNVFYAAIFTKRYSTGDI